MALWEYKVISSGKGGFATPALLEKFLNDIGKEQWEIIEFRTAPDNALAFSGLARRPTQRDWTLEDAAAAAAKVEADKMRAEFEAKFRGATPAAAGPAETQTGAALDEKVAPDDGFRQPIDTSRDQDPEADDEPETGSKEDWDKLVQEDELPTFFEAIRPHMRRNQRGPGTSVGVDYLAKKWGFDEADVVNALKECGFDVPDDEDAKPVYLEYDGDLYWVNINRRGELWINTKEKPQPIFRVVSAQRVTPEEPAPKSETAAPADAAVEPAAAPTEVKNPRPKGQPQSAPLPAGLELLEKIRPKMRRNRHDAGGSGSTSFLTRAFKCSEADLLAAFAGLGLVLPENPGDKPVFIEIGAELWWLNRDQRGGIWINGREKKAGETAQSASEAEPQRPAEGATASTTVAAGEPAPAAVSDPAPVPAVSQPAPAGSDAVLAGARLLLKPTRTGGVAAEVTTLAEQTGRSVEDLVAALVAAGLKVPEKPREKPVFVEHAGEIFWFNRNAKDQLWLNAKASKFADPAGEVGDRPKRSRSKKGE
ncbi:MAG: hypothetical protein ACHQ4G_02935 [Opitutales bacterium]